MCLAKFCPSTVSQSGGTWTVFIPLCLYFITTQWYDFSHTTSGYIYSSKFTTPTNLRPHPHTPGRYPRCFTNSLWRNFFLCAGLGKSGVSSQGLWAKSWNKMKVAVRWCWFLFKGLIFRFNRHSFCFGWPGSCRHHPLTTWRIYSTVLKGWGWGRFYVVYPHEQWKKGPVLLFRVCVGDEILHSFVGDYNNKAWNKDPGIKPPV